MSALGRAQNDGSAILHLPQTVVDSRSKCLPLKDLHDSLVVQVSASCSHFLLSSRLLRKAQVNILQIELRLFENPARANTRYNARSPLRHFATLEDQASSSDDPSVRADSSTYDVG